MTRNEAELMAELGAIIGYPIPRNARSRNLRIVTAPDWSVSTMTGTGIPRGACVIHHSRMVRQDGRTQHINSADNGRLVSQRMADTIALSLGRVRPYSRNSCEFVQSRAARKRGIVATNGRYLSMAAHYARKRATE